MDGAIQFITDLDEFIQKTISIINSENDCKVLISGTFDSKIYKEIFESIMKNNHARRFKIIIPIVSKSGVLSRAYINKIYRNGGEVRINSKFRNNIIVIGKYVILIALTSKYNSECGIRTSFESCIITDDVDTVKKAEIIFMGSWSEGVLIENI